MSKKALLFFAAIFQTSLCENEQKVNTNNNYKNSYYFRIGKNNNEFKVNNRIYFLNHNITDYVYPQQGVAQNIQRQNDAAVRNSPKHFKSDCYLDEEWNYHSKNHSRPDLPLFVHKFYEKRTGDPSIRYTTRILFNVNSNTSSSIIKFNLDSLQEDEVVLDADMYFYWPLKNDSEIFKQSVVLRLYQFENQYNGELNESNLIENPDVHKLFNVIYVSKAHKGWQASLPYSTTLEDCVRNVLKNLQTFKLKKPVDNWLSGEDNLGLLLTIASYDTNKLIEIFNDTNAGIYRTFATVKVVKNDTLIERIHSNPHQEPVHESSCQTTEWNINFAALGWDSFIVSPQNFTTYDCMGKCGNSFTESNNHVKLLNIFHKRASCCVPVDYESLPIMYYDKFENVVIKNYDDVIVSACGCR